MEIHTDRRHRFEVGPEELWAALVRVDDYRTWWPWLSHFEGDAFTAGTSWRCQVQPPLPYALHFDLTLGEVTEGRSVTATVDGDIVGRARLEIGDDPAGSAMRLESWLRPANPVLRTIATVGRPVVRYGHDWVIDTGLRQFRSRAL